MCSEYTFKGTVKDLAKELGESLTGGRTESWDTRVRMSRTAPVLVEEKDQIGAKPLLFPVNPFPNSRLSQSESNKKKKKLEGEDQIIRIYDIPLWKTSFEKSPCIVPMTSFYEPAYWGEEKGKVVEFQDPKSDFLFVPAILIKPRVPATGKYDGFSLLTHTASDQMLKYHHRLIMLLKAKDAAKYLRMGDVSAEERYDFLLQHRYVPKLKVSIDRTMAKGWEKRVEHHEHSLKDEKKYRKTLEKEGVEG